MLIAVDHTYRLSTATTSNGIRLSVSPDPWVSGVAVNLWYGVGSVHERPGKTGFAHLFEHLMFSGSARVASGEHLAALQAIGGNTNATTSFDRTNYYDTIPAGGLELALWLEAERLRSLLEGVDQAGLDVQRDVVKEEKRQRYDNVPYGDAFPAMMDFVFPRDHPYAHMPIGSMPDLDAATLEDVHGFFRRHYTPANLIMTLVGAVEPDQGLELVERYFADIPAGSPTDPPGFAALPSLAGIPRLELAGDVPQDVIYCCWLVPPVADRANDPLGLGLGVMAGSMTSRLHTELVRTSLADSVDTFDFGLQHGNSLVVATAACADGVDPARVEETMMAAWEGFCDEGPVPEEVSRCKRSEDREFLADLASVEDRADHISAAWSLFGDPEEVNRHLDKVHALGAADVQAVFSTWLRPEQRAVLTYRSAS